MTGGVPADFRTSGGSGTPRLPGPREVQPDLAAHLSNDLHGREGIAVPRTASPVRAPQRPVAHRLRRTTGPGRQKGCLRGIDRQEIRRPDGAAVPQAPKSPSPQVPKFPSRGIPESLSPSSLPVPGFPGCERSRATSRLAIRPFPGTLACGIPESRNPSSLPFPRFPGTRTIARHLVACHPTVARAPRMWNPGIPQAFRSPVSRDGSDRAPRCGLPSNRALGRSYAKSRNSSSLPVLRFPRMRTIAHHVAACRPAVPRGTRMSS